MLTDQDIAKLIKAQEQVFATRQDINTLATKNDFEALQASFSDLQTSVDRYLKFTEAWHQELVILKHRQDRLTQALVNKGVITEQEIALIS